MKTMTNKRKHLKFAMPATILAGVFWAMPVNAGTIQGRVTDNQDGSYLTGVQVEIAGLDRTTTTDREGRFAMTGIPGGQYSLTVRYIGYDPKNEIVQVPQEGSSSVLVSMGSEVFELEAFKVEGYMEGQAKAMQQKKTADYFMEVVSADSAGNLPDRNVADALSRLPGISLDSDGGEGRFVTIRGIDPNLNNVTLNGASLAAPGVEGRSGRSMPLDVIGSSQISQLEVIKTVTPDMDGNSLGGSINIKTASGFDRPKRYISGMIEFGEANLSGGSIGGADISFSDSSKDGKHAISLSASYEDRSFVSHDTQADFDQADDGRWWISQFEMQPRSGSRERIGFNMNYDFRPSEDFEMYVRTIFNEFSEDMQRQEYVIETRRDAEFVSDSVTTYDRMRWSARTYDRVRDQSLRNISVGGKRSWGQNTIEIDVTTSYADEQVPTILATDFRSGNINLDDDELFMFDSSGFYPTFDQSELYRDYGDWDMRRFRIEDSTVEEDLLTYRVDYRRDFDTFMGDKSGYLKTGIKRYDRDRFVDDNSLRPNGDYTMGDIATPGPGFDFMDGRYTYPFSMVTSKYISHYEANKGSYEIDEIESATNSVEDDYDIEEKIDAFYAMANIDWTSNLNVIVGVRLEETDASVTANEARFSDDGDEFEGIFENSNAFSYSNWLPNAQIAYKLGDNAVLRAAITGTIGRPAYEDAAPIATLEYYAVPDDEIDDGFNPSFPNVGSLEIGNPLLEPYDAINFDLSYEYYFPSGGMVSAAVFQKNIDNPIFTYRTERENYTYNGIGFEELELESYQNAISGEVKGLELAGSFPFRSFMPDNQLLNGFGVDVNASFFSSSADVDFRTDDLPFFRQPDLIYNASLYYEKNGLMLRIAYQYQDASLFELDDSPDLDIWESAAEYTDFQARYNISNNYSVFLNVKNIFDGTDDQFYGDPSRMRRSEYFGSSVRAGLKFRY